MEKQKVVFKTFGCKVNQYETQAIREGFLGGPYEEVEGPPQTVAGPPRSVAEKADIYVINSCTVTADADRECRALIRACRRENPDAKIVVTGCYAQKDGSELLRVGGVTHLIRHQDKARIREIVEGRGLPRPRAALTYVPLRISDFKDHTRAFVKVQDGCDYRCSFCKVWVVRGRSVSRLPEEIVAEVRRLAARGFKEIVLTGVSIGLYGKDFLHPFDLIDLVFALEEVPEIERIRLSSIDPIDVTAPFIEKLLSSRKCCRQLHLSLQSGSDSLLRRMNRNYTTDHYRAIVGRFREKIPDFSITTDVIVGFPGETETQFEETLAFIREILPTRVHIFPYSARKGTIAYRFSAIGGSASGGQDPVPPSVIRARSRCLKSVALESSLDYRRSLLGQTVSILLEEAGPEGELSGYTDRYVKVECNADAAFIGELIPVRIEQIEAERTFGRVV